MNAYRNLPSFRGRAEFSTWLYVIARNRCWSEGRRPRLFVDEETSPDELHAGAGDPASQYLESRSAEEILEIIRTHLDPLEQRVLWLRCFERLSIARITALLEIERASGARGVLQRARRHLRAALEQRGYLKEPPR